MIAIAIFLGAHVRLLTRRKICFTLKSLTRTKNRPTVDNDFSSSLTYFFHCSKSNEEDFRRAIQLFENTVGVNRGHTKNHQTSQVIDMQLCRLSITWYRIGCRKRTLTFRSFISGFAALEFTGFVRIPIFAMGRKVEIVPFIIRFYGII